MRFGVLFVLAFSTTILDAYSIEEAGPELDLEYYSNLEVKDSDLNLDGNDHTYDANLFEGDIALTNREYLINSTDGRIENRNAIADKTKKWPGGVMPYLYYSGYTESQKAIIAKAIKRLEDVTCLRMKQRTNEANYIYIKPAGGCHSHVGCSGRGQQVLSLDKGCFYIGSILHELMHAVGFWHEHSRADRDDYVKVNWENIIEGQKHNFNKYTLGTQISHLGATYDYCSLMHYGYNLWSKNWKLLTLEKKHKRGCGLGYQNDILTAKHDYSDMDIRKMNTLYKCSGYPQV